MMALVRVKRRCDEEPLDIFLLACKKRKTEDITETSVFKFAATVSEQEHLPLDLSNTFKADSENLIKKKGTNVEEITKRLRTEHQLLSKNSRFKVVNCYRALDENEFNSEGDVQEASNSTSKTGITILDVESNQVKDNCVTDSKDGDLEEKYVYDLYYTADSADLNDLQLEHIHSVHGVDELVFDSPRDPGGIDSDDNFDDEDDSNDENNWRNDYPDEEDGFSGCGEDDDDDDRILRARFSGFGLGICDGDDDDDDDGLSSDDNENIYDGNLDQTDVCYFGKSYARYKAKVLNNNDEYDSSCSVDDDNT